MILFGSIFGFFNDWINSFLSSPGSEVWVYVLLGAIIFIETGLVIFPFLPGDSILFFVGSLAARPANPANNGKLNLIALILVMGTLAFLANLVNYEIGRKFGDAIPKHKLLSRFLKQEYLDEAHQFFEKWGSWAIFLGRFMPIIRTIVPFTAGTGRMPQRKFIFFNFLGGFSWVTVALGAGYLFGGIRLVQENFELIMIAIVLVSLLPAIIAFGKRFLTGRKK